MNEEPKPLLEQLKTIDPESITEEQIRAINENTLACIEELKAMGFKVKDLDADDNNN